MNHDDASWWRKKQPRVELNRINILHQFTTAISDHIHAGHILYFTPRDFWIKAQGLKKKKRQNFIDGVNFKMASGTRGAEARYTPLHSNSTSYTFYKITSWKLRSWFLTHIYFSYFTTNLSLITFTFLLFFTSSSPSTCASQVFQHDCNPISKHLENYNTKNLIILQKTQQFTNRILKTLTNSPLR